MFKYQSIEVTGKDDYLIDIGQLHARIFGYFNLAEAKRKLELNETPLILVSFDNQDHLVGFKIGYKQSDEVFFSWLGGVDEKYRRLGIASTLMQIQHEWCKRNNFRIIETHTTLERESMLQLDLKFGFKETARFIDERGHEKIILQKRI